MEEKFKRYEGKTQQEVLVEVRSDLKNELIEEIVDAPGTLLDAKAKKYCIEAVNELFASSTDVAGIVASIGISFMDPSIRYQYLSGILPEVALEKVAYEQLTIPAEKQECTCLNDILDDMRGHTKAIKREFMN